jgi:peptide/nickel transport system substrate-binding protein
MAVIRKRLIFWLIKAYIKKSGKTILISFIVGLIIFFALLFTAKYYSYIIPFSRTETVGLVGAYSGDNLPQEITDMLSIGLTKIGQDGAIEPGLASNWDILDKGKTYRFHLKPGLHFSDGQEVTADTINYNFSDVTEMKPDKYTIVFKLKDSYAPFLVAVAKPIFDNGFSGIGDYRLEKYKTNSSFVQSLTLVSTKGEENIINYDFYPSEDAVKTAYLLGEVSRIENISQSTYESMQLQKYRNTTVTKQADYSQLVTLFFNNDDGALSNKKTRIALTYAIPNTFKEGTRAYSPYPPNSQFYNKDIDQRTEDIARAKTLLQPDSSSTSSVSGQEKAPTKLTIKTIKKYRPTAQEIATEWKKLGINTSIEEVDGIPDNYQIFLGDFNIPKDPDQYTLWHSEGPDNITHYKNLRIDKLLEDGRKTASATQRKSIYMDFQKFLMEDAPAIFLYYPDEYTVTRK